MTTEILAATHEPGKDDEVNRFWREIFSSRPTMTTEISAATHTLINDGQTRWIVAMPEAQALAELRAIDEAYIEDDEDGMIKYGEWCQSHEAVAEYGEAIEMAEEYGLPTVSYLPGTGWQ